MLKQRKKEKWTQTKFKPIFFSPFFKNFQILKPILLLWKKKLWYSFVLRKFDQFFTKKRLYRDRHVVHIPVRSADCHHEQTCLICTGTKKSFPALWSIMALAQTTAEQEHSPSEFGFLIKSERNISPQLRRREAVRPDGFAAGGIRPSASFGSGCLRHRWGFSIRLGSQATQGNTPNAHTHILWRVSSCFRFNGNMENRPAGCFPETFPKSSGLILSGKVEAKLDWMNLLSNTFKRTNPICCRVSPPCSRPVAAMCCRELLPKPFGSKAKNKTLLCCF